jgi:hypothetical protein
MVAEKGQEVAKSWETDILNLRIEEMRLIHCQMSSLFVICVEVNCEAADQSKFREEQVVAASVDLSPQANST